jgi:hypothetical protein
MLGEALVLLAREGRKASTEPLPEPCLTCAFRSGTIANMTANTALDAFNCSVGAIDAEFACHHGMEDGRPTRRCAGYEAALLAPFERMKEIVQPLHDLLIKMEDGGPDAIRADFDAWYAATDPDGLMDIYQLSRAYARRTTA